MDYLLLSGNSGNAFTSIYLMFMSLIPILGIGTVLLIAGAVFLIVYNNNKEYFNNKWAMMTKTDLEYFRYVADRQIEKSDESLKKMQTKAEDRKKDAF